MKLVTFNVTLDVYDLCNNQLRTMLKVHHGAAVKEEEGHLTRKKSSPEEDQSWNITFRILK